MLREQGLINPNSGLETFSTRPSMCATVGFILTKSTHGCCEEKKKKEDLENVLGKHQRE